MPLPQREFNDQDFSPAAVKQKLEKIEAALFGFDVPDYVTPPTDAAPYPPINQVQDKNPDGTLKYDQFGRPVMIDKFIHHPGLITNFNSMYSKAHGVEPAGEGEAAQMSNTHPGAVDTNRVPISTDVPGTEAHGGSPSGTSAKSPSSQQKKN